MNKKNYLISIALLSGILAGCNLQMPEKISVKTNSSYSFSVGELDFTKLASSLGTSSENGIELYDSITSAMNKGSKDDSSSAGNSSVTIIKDSNFAILDYNPTNSSDSANTVQQLAVKVPIQKVDLDFNQYINKLNLEDNLKNMNMSYKIDIPDISNVNQTQTVSSDLINKTINTGIVISALANQKAYAKPVMADGNGFDSIKYKSGKLNIKVLLGANVDSSLTTTIGVNGSEVVITNGVGAYDLAGVTIPKEGIEFDTTKIFAGIVYGTIDESSQIDTVSNLTIQAPMTINTSKMTVSTGNSSALQKVIIEKGDASVDLNFPGWTGVIGDLSLTIDKESLCDKDGNDVVIKSGAGKKDLKDAVYSNKDISITPSFSLTFKNANLTFEDGKDPNFTFALNIETLKEIKVLFDSSLSFENKITYPLPDDAKKLIKEIVWKESGVKINVKNGLPAGNDMSITVTSDFLGIQGADKTKTISSGDTESKSYTWFCEDGHTSDITSNSTIDFNVLFSLNGYDKDSHILTLNGVGCNQSYDIDLEVVIKDKETGTQLIDWKAITIYNDATEIKGSKDMQLNIADTLKNLDSSGSFISYLTLDESWLRLYCDIDEGLAKLFDNPAFTGQIAAISGEFDEAEQKIKEENQTTLNMLGRYGESDGTMSIDSLPKAFVKKEDGTYDKITSDIKDENFIDVSTLLRNITKAGNGLGFNYKVKFSTGKKDSGTITINKVDLEDVTSASIDLSAVLILPLKFKITTPDSKDMVLDNLLSSVSSGGDILNRTSDQDMNDVKNYVKYVKSMDLIMKKIKFPLILDKPINIKIDLNGPEATPGDSTSVKKLNIADGNISTTNLDLSTLTVKVDPEELFNIYPLSPQAYITIPDGSTIGLPRAMQFKTSVMLRLTMDGSEAYPLWEKNATSESGNN